MSDIASHLMPNEIVFLITFVVTIIVGFCFAFWYDMIHKPSVKPQVTICWKCKYCVKKRWINKITCRTPSDKGQTNYITGRTYKPTFNCDRHNSYGTCEFFKKVWWRR